MGQKSFNHIADELQAHINELIKSSGLTDKEWIAKATEAWHLQAMKEEVPDFRKEITEVETLTQRLRAIFVNMAQQTAFDKVDIRRQMEEALEAKRKEIDQLHVYQAQLEKDTKAAVEETKRQTVLREESEKYAKQVDESSTSNKALAESYKEKNETLTNMVTEYKAGHDAAQLLREQLAESSRDKRDLERQLSEAHSDLEASIKVSDERVLVIEERHEEQKQRMAERQAAELDKRDIEHERTLLKLRTELQEQSTKEIRELYERIEKSRREHDHNVESIRKERDRKIEAVQAQMEAMKAEYERQIAELKKLKPTTPKEKSE